jgi:ribokinase
MHGPIVNFGSLNLDRVYRVPHIVRPGETLPSRAVEVLAGGKGANQSVALARAGAAVVHCGKVGADGGWLVEKLAREGVDTRFIGRSEKPTGEAIIQVADDGENAIILLPGANHDLTRDDLDRALATCTPSTVVLTQNETSEVAYVIERASALGLAVVFNPAPFNSDVLGYPLGKVTTLIVNESEGAGLSGQQYPDAILGSLRKRLPAAELILTLGSRGAIADTHAGQVQVQAVAAPAVDTTAAGDTFIGYFLAERQAGGDIGGSMQAAARAAALCVSRRGAIDSIPFRSEI